jgi:hypothetical protein
MSVCLLPAEPTCHARLPLPLCPTNQRSHTPPQIHRTHALLLAWASPAYRTTKLSSTILTSLMTATPVIADTAVLESYGFLTREDVFLMEEGEDEVDAMMRVGGGGRAHGAAAAAAC